MKVYPSRRYHPDLGNKLVMNEQEDDALGIEWVQSPAEYGHETCPGREPDPAIIANGEEYRKRVADAKAKKSKKSTEPKVGAKA